MTGEESNSAAETTSWTDGFEEETKAYISKKGWESPGDLLTSYQNLEKLSSGSSQVVALPGEKATEEEYADFYIQLGRPDKPENYEFEKTDQTDESLLGWFQKTAHQNGLTTRQAKSFYESWNKEQQQRTEQVKEQLAQDQQKELDNLKAELGDKFEQQVHSGQQVVKALGFDVETLAQWENKMGTTDFMKLFLALGSKMNEDNFVGGALNGGFAMSASEAAVELNELNNDSAFMKRYLNGEKDAVAKYQRVMQAKYG